MLYLHFFITSAVALLLTEFELGTVGSPCSIGFSGFNSGLGTSGFDSDSEGIVDFCSSSVSGFEGVTGFWSGLTYGLCSISVFLFTINLTTFEYLLV